MPLNTAVVEEVNVAVPMVVRKSSSPLAVVSVTEGVPVLEVMFTVPFAVTRPRGKDAPLPEAATVVADVKANFPIKIASKKVVWVWEARAIGELPSVSTSRTSAAGIRIFNARRK